MASSPAPTLTCAQCGFVNEAERVYCHNCGTKLDRSLLPKESPRKAESLDATRRRVRQMTNPGGGILPHLKTALNVLIYAAIVAALLLIALPPETIPPKVELSERLVGSDLLDAVESPQPRQLVFSENDVNAHFRGLKSKTGGWIPGLEFKRAYVQFFPGVVRINTEQLLWKYSVFTSIDYRLSVDQGGTFIAEQNGGRFGRLAIHPLLMAYGSAAFDKLWVALKREHDQMKRMQSVTVQKGRVILVTKPARRS